MKWRFLYKSHALKPRDWQANLLCDCLHLYKLTGQVPILELLSIHSLRFSSWLHIKHQMRAAWIKVGWKERQKQCLAKSHPCLKSLNWFCLFYVAGIGTSLPVQIITECASLLSRCGLGFIFLLRESWRKKSSLLAPLDVLSEFLATSRTR